MYTFFLIILIITSIVLVVAILAQAGKGGGLAANFGGAGSSSDSFMGSRQASNLLTKTSWIAGGTFLALAFILSLASSRADTASSVLDGAFPPAAPIQATPGSGSGTGATILTPPPTSDTTGAGGTKMTPPPGL